MNLLLLIPPLNLLGRSDALGMSDREALQHGGVVVELVS
jgi:hypothetical protein